MAIGGFFEENFVSPMREGTGYNLATTALIGGLLVLFSFWLAKTPYFRKRACPEILKDALPFVIFGALSRSLEDGCFLPCSWPIRLLFITPGIWILTFLLFISLERLAPKRARIAGWLLFLFPAALFLLSGISNWKGLLIILGLGALSSAAVVLAILPLAESLYEKKGESKWSLSLSGKAVLLAHIFDASSTFVAVSYFGYFEEHVFARAVMSLGGPFLFFIVKIAGISALLLFSENEKLSGFSEGERKLLLVAMFLVGLGPAIRNTASVAMGV